MILRAGVNAVRALFDATGRRLVKRVRHRLVEALSDRKSATPRLNLARGSESQKR